MHFFWIFGVFACYRAHARVMAATDRGDSAERLRRSYSFHWPPAPFCKLSLLPRR